MKTTSLRIRLLWRLALLLTLGIVAIGVFAYSNAREEAEEMYDAQLAHFAKIIAALSQDELDEGDMTPRVISTDNSRFITPYEKDFAYRVWWKNVAVLQSDNAVLLGEASQSLGYMDRMTSRGLWRFFVLQDGDMIIEVGEDYEARQDLILKISNSILLPFLLVFPLVLAAIWCSVRFAMAPLDRLQEHIRRQRPEALEPIDLGRIPKEVDTLVKALNTLVVQVEDIIAREKRFTGYAAHELRTPLAALRTQVQVALRTHDPAEQQRLFGEVVGGIDRMGHLVQQLLLLVRAQSLTAPQTPLKLSELVQKLCEEMRPIAADKQQVLITDIAPMQLIMGDEAMIGVLLRNLLDNAIRYSPESASLNVMLMPNEAGVALTVENSGIALSEEQCKHMFEPFYRSQKNDTEGVGIGLSIVAWIAKQHRGTIHCVPEQGKTTITVQFSAY